MVVITLLAIFASIAVPSFTTLIANTRTETAASELHGLLMSARSDAVTKRTPITLEKNASNWQTKQGSTLTGTLALPSNVSVTPSPAALTSLSFSPDGSASQPVTLCLENDRGSKIYKINIQPAGGIRLSSSTSCG